MKIFITILIPIGIVAFFIKFLYEYSKNMARLKRLDDLMDKVDRNEMDWEEFDKINDLDLKRKE